MTVLIGVLLNVVGYVGLYGVVTECAAVCSDCAEQLPSMNVPIVHLKLRATFAAAGMQSEA